ncbi:MAG: hypothetical protein LBM62_06190 [Mediterranea sp.]|jgi:hypothetical protein|nr:hypothetical protein [Mediterranea sp.]
MARIIQTLLLFLLLVFFWEYAGNGKDEPSRVNVETVAGMQEPGSYASVHHDYLLQDAEPNPFAGQIGQRTFARSLRAQLSEHEFLSLPVNRRLAHRTALLAQLNEQRSYIYPQRLTRSACDYYIFTLRHIVI